MMDLTAAQNQTIEKYLGYPASPKVTKIAGDGGSRIYHRIAPQKGASSTILMQLDSQYQ